MLISWVSRYRGKPRAADDFEGPRGGNELGGLLMTLKMLFLGDTVLPSSPMACFNQFAETNKAAAQACVADVSVGSAF